MSAVKKIAELEAARTSAGVRYAAAVAELQSALVDLEAIDRTLVCKNHAGLEGHHYQFRRLPQTLADLEHPEFVPELSAELADQVAVVARNYMEMFTQ